MLKRIKQRLRCYRDAITQINNPSPQQTFLTAGRHLWPYDASSQPAMLKYQVPQSYLYSGKAIEQWTYNEFAPFINEVGNYERFWFLASAAGYLVTSGTKGDYHEYGICTATTFRIFLTQAKLMGYTRWHPDVQFHGFDSFEGLPAFETSVAEGHVWTPGSMAFSEEQFWQAIREHGLFVDRVKTHKGFYKDTLTKELQKQFMDSGRKIAFANIDCDLYESAVPVFEFIDPLLQEGTLIYLDDYFAGYNGSPKRGVAGAFNEYKAKSRFAFQPFRTVGHWGRSFIAYYP